MTGDNRSKFSTKELVESLQETLVSYLEAQYHIRNEHLLAQRNALLNSDGTVWQEPYIEATQSYKAIDGYSELGLPSYVKDTLAGLAELGVGIPRTPYQHQASALSEFFVSDHDLIVSTGTGSGKTESFLMPIIGQLAKECNESASSEMAGVRALLLYPMNALVNDQLSRVRRLFGDEQANKLIRGDRDRPIRFASYTSRTPYAGKRSSKKDRQQIEPLFEDYYLNEELTEDVVSKLKDIGKWPAKDLEGFYASNQATEGTYKKGKNKGKSFIRSNFDKRLKTQPDDRELMTRHEVHLMPPEILITNYSMLEYMMLRPIEKSIFDETRAWLHSDSKNEFLHRHFRFLS